MGRTKVIAALLVALLLAAGLTWVVLSLPARINTDLQFDRITQAHPEVSVPGGLRLDVRAFYEDRDLTPAWIAEHEVGPRVAAALAVLDDAAKHGLNPEDYRASALRAHRDALAPTADGNRAGSNREAALLDFDVELTSALLALGHHVAVGRTPPADLNSRWRSRRDPPNLPRTLSRALNTNLGTWLDEIAPRHGEYHALKSVLADPARLAASERDDAAAVVAANMERWRWAPDDFGARHFYVNIPSFTLIARKPGADDLSMRVVVGKAKTNETPILSSRISALVFSPSWNIPASIVANETIPAFLRDPAYLARVGIDAMRPADGGYVRVDPATLKGATAGELKRMLYRQRPGPANALGQVKFPFPNEHDVYLHDTPADGAFGRVMRALSHGCVRLERPEVLAAYALGSSDDAGNSGWTEARIRRAMVSGREQFVKLPEPVAVHLVYFTASVNEAGELVFLSDIYGLDARHSAAGGDALTKSAVAARVALFR